MTATYAWIVDKDPAAEPHDELNRVGTIGPRNAPEDLVQRLLEGEGERWRTVYEPGEDPEHDDVVHEGRILFVEGQPETYEEPEFGPLYDLSQPDCCAVDIEYRKGARVGEALMADLVNRAANYRDVLARFPELFDPDSVAAPEDLAEPQRYLLVERSIYDHTVWVTLAESLEAAGEYHDTQEYPEDWTIEGLWDLDTGEEYYPVPHTSWEVKPTV